MRSFSDDSGPPDQAGFLVGPAPPVRAVLGVPVSPEPWHHRLTGRPSEHNGAAPTGTRTPHPSGLYANPAVSGETSSGRTSTHPYPDGSVPRSGVGSGAGRS